MQNVQTEANGYCTALVADLMEQNRELEAKIDSYVSARPYLNLQRLFNVNIHRTGHDARNRIINEFEMIDCNAYIYRPECICG